MRRKQLLAAIARPEPLTVCVSGTITLPAGMYDVASDKSIVGVGATAGISGGGLNIGLPVSTATTPPADAVHNGSIDIVRGADYVTVSWNHFAATDKSMLIGHSDGAASTDVGHLRVSIHHNFFDHSRQRHPRVRFGEPVHVYNNYFLGNELYAVASTMNGGVLVEGNYFSGVAHPCHSTGG